MSREQNALHITLTGMKTQNTTTKCTLCGKSTNHKTYYVAMTRQGLVCVTRCPSKDLILIGQSSSKTEANTIAVNVAKGLA